MAKRQRAGITRVAKGKGRPKLDPRLAWLISLGPDQLLKLRQREAAEFKRIEDEILAERRTTANDRRRRTAENRSPSDRLFAPLTTGVYFPRAAGQPPTPINLREPWFSCFVLSDASAPDLTRLGVRVRSQQCDIMTVFLPWSRVDRLEQSVGVRYIELGAPVVLRLEPGGSVQRDRSAAGRPATDHRQWRHRRRHRQPHRLLPSRFPHGGRRDAAALSLGSDTGARSWRSGAAYCAGAAGIHPDGRRDLRRRIQPGDDQRRVERFQSAWDARLSDRSPLAACARQHQRDQRPWHLRDRSGRRKWPWTRSGHVHWCRSEREPDLRAAARHTGDPACG
jgi:hypothetical protein